MKGKGKRGGFLSSVRCHVPEESLCGLAQVVAWSIFSFLFIFLFSSGSAVLLFWGWLGCSAQGWDSSASSPLPRGKVRGGLFLL